MQPKLRAARTFFHDDRAVAAIEFAMVLPIMMLLLLGGFDVGTGVVINTKTRGAASTLSQLTSQYSTISNADMQEILGATAVVFSPYSTSTVAVVISQLTIDNSGKVTVSWSDSLNATARSVGSVVAIPATLVIPNTTLIFSEVRYVYTPTFGFVFTGAITLSDKFYAVPRLSTTIARTA